jgi:hypothetical protein
VQDPQPAGHREQVVVGERGVHLTPGLAALDEGQHPGQRVGRVPRWHVALAYERRVVVVDVQARTRTVPDLAGAADVIGMSMGDQDALDLLGPLAHGRQSGHDAPRHAG